MKFEATHGLHNSPEYKSWIAMKKRCYYPKHPRYRLYGGRGIAVCERWRFSFVNFLADMGRKAQPHFVLDRIDGNRGYEPANCRWVSRKANARNRRDGFLITVGGETKPLSEWAERTGINRRTIRLRVAHGWPTEALFIPSRKTRRVTA